MTVGAGVLVEASVAAGVLAVEVLGAGPVVVMLEVACVVVALVEVVDFGSLVVPVAGKLMVLGVSLMAVMVVDRLLMLPAGVDACLAVVAAVSFM